MAKIFYDIPARPHGSYLTETVWDRVIRDNINNKIVPPLYKGQQNFLLTIKENDFTEQTPDAVLIDTDGIHPVLTNGELNPTIRTPGFYLIQFSGVWFTGGTSTQGPWYWNIRLEQRPGAQLLGLISGDVVNGEAAPADVFWTRGCSALTEASVKDEIVARIFSGPRPAIATGMARFGNSTYDIVWVGRT
jgi:hypothetical protein